MKQNTTLYLALFAAVQLGVVPCVAETTNSGEDLHGTVTYLIDYVAKSDCHFVRNGKSQGPVAASRHIKAKYDHFRKEIKTPEDFIRLAASKSLLTGKAYKVRTKDGKEMDCAEWMSTVLDHYRETISTSESAD